MRLRSPFILLDDAPHGEAVRLYQAPREIVRADTLAEVRPALDRLRSAQRAGLHAAGYLGYEAGAALEPHVGEPHGQDPPLLWFGLFETYDTLSADAVAALLPDPAGAWAGAAQPRIARARYLQQFERVQALIQAGDIYQANLSFRASVPVAGDPAALYALLRSRQLAGYGALVATGSHWLLSLSPELFFRLDGGTLTARPMKGTVKRGDAASDAAAIAALHDDPKQRAENLMIVDLLRNDLSRVAAAGSVTVPELFTVETYPTVHTMTSTIRATIAPEHDAVDAIAALFPCGSVTGAPKIRAMQVIAEVEHGPRNAYTGSIGRIDANGDAAFNVAIRTLELEEGANEATLGLGGGIVADSRGSDEWEECLTKSGFVTAGEKPFDLIETMRFDPQHGIALLDRHLARIGASARVFHFTFDRHMIRNELQAATFRLREPSRVRLLVAASGAIAIGIAPLPVAHSRTLRVALSPLPVDPRDFRLTHKTSRRRFHDGARMASGADEVVFTDLEGFITEGSYTSVFVARGDTLVTPRIVRGLLPGVLRAELLDTGRAIEGDLRPEDLADGFLLGNALRGLMPAKLTIAQRAFAPL